MSHPVTPSINCHHLRVMQQPIEQRSCQYLISQQRSPLRKTRVTRQQDRPSFVPSHHQLKQLVRLLYRQPRISHLVDHQHPRHYVAPQPVPPQARMRCCCQILFGVASVHSLGIMAALAWQKAVKVLCPRDRMTDRCAAPPCVFSEAVYDPFPASCQDVPTRVALNTLLAQPD